MCKICLEFAIDIRTMGEICLKRTRKTLEQCVKFVPS